MPVTALTLVTTTESDGAGFEPIRRLLYHSWSPIHFKYEGLTIQERATISREDFEALVPWVRSLS